MTKNNFASLAKAEGIETEYSGNQKKMFLHGDKKKIKEFKASFKGTKLPFKIG